eukprot:TRINITY_DN3909_c0_g3_i1.p1 TRINITY_DN3909_c0_g3~~TRINITY_DN3909_c0_g3_i1.p1  ORF type:complete len:271 (-),score=39.45 TRINITY_DN3909_c0_g3_i1:132-944(-)
MGKIVPYCNAFVEVKDDGVLSDTLMALVYLTMQGSESIQLMLKHVKVQPILSLITHKNLTIANPAIKIIGNICADTENGIKAILEVKEVKLSDGQNLGMQLLKTALNDLEGNIDLQRDLCWTLSNIATVSSAYVQLMIDSEIINDLCSITSQTRDYNVIREAAWALSNACTTGTFYQVWQIVEAGFTTVIKRLLPCADLELQETLLYGLVKILECGATKNEENQLAMHFESLGGLELLEQMQYNKNEEIAKFAAKIVKQYYQTGGVDAFS